MYSRRSFAGLSIWSVVLLFVCVFSGIQAQLGPGNKSNTCNFAWRNRLYILGGSPDPNSYNSANFTYTNFPIDTTSSIQWHDLIFNSAANYNPAGEWNLDAWPCLVSPSNIVVVGGYNMIGYDLVNNLWVPINATGDIPPPSLQSSTNVRFTNMADSFILFDGYTGSGLQAASYQNYFVFNTSTWIWKSGPVNLPPPNYDSSQLAYAAGLVYMIGGSVNTSIGHGVYYEDIYHFNLVTQAWTLTAHPLDMGIDWPSAANWKDQKVFIFGGGTAQSISVDPSQLSNQVRLLNIADETLTLLTPSSQNDDSVTPPPMITGKLAVQDDCFIVFGGGTGPWNNRTRDGKLYIFNFTVLDWVHTAAAVPLAGSSPTQPTNSTNATSTPVPTVQGGSVSVGPIVGGVVGGVVVIAAVAGFLVYWRRRTAIVPPSIPGNSVYQAVPPPLKPDEDSHALSLPLYQNQKPDEVGVTRRVA